MTWFRRLLRRTSDRRGHSIDELQWIYDCGTLLDELEKMSLAADGAELDFGMPSDQKHLYGTAAKRRKLREKGIYHISIDDDT